MREKCKLILTYGCLLAILASCCEIFVVQAQETDEVMQEIEIPGEENLETFTDVAIDETNFPDIIFRQYVLDNIDSNKNELLSQRECYGVTELYLMDKKISSLKGIEHFVNLTKLRCERNALTTLDVSNNTRLTSLTCDYNQITSLNINGCNQLTYLECGANSLGGLDVSGCPRLETLRCSNGNLTTLNASGCRALSYLDCGYNQLSVLDLEENLYLQKLYCSYNQFTTLDVSNNTRLTDLECVANKLDTLDVSRNQELRWLYCCYNQISQLDVSDNAYLQDMHCDSNYMKSLTLPDHELNYLCIVDNFFTEQQVQAYSEKARIFEGRPQIDRENSSWGYADRLYQVCLGRTPAESEVMYWDMQLRRKTREGRDQQTGIQVASCFVFSPECSKRCVTDTQYITTLYQSLMGRTPASSEVNYWRETLNAGLSRKYVFKCFAESPEFTSLCMRYNVKRGNYVVTEPRDTNANLTKYVNRLYMNSLGRGGDVDGLNYWCRVILSKRTTPVAAAEYFILSPEFTKKNLNNTEYIKVLYRTFMDREADQVGMNYWVGQLGKGVSRQSVLRSFAGCQEFKKIMAGFGL